MPPIPARRSLVWLASYPKSGNTWLRAFLANYFFAAEGPLPLEHIVQVSFGDSAIEPMARMLGGRDPRGLAPADQQRLRHRLLAAISARGEVNFVKTHNARIKLHGLALIPPALTRAAIAILRDPRDVVLSYADHWGLDHAAAAAQMADPQNVIPGNPKTMVQTLTDWSGHVRSWTRSAEPSALVLRYEDLLADPEAGFRRVLSHLGAPVDAGVLRAAIGATSFDTLRAAEEARGFAEKGAAQSRFFRKGTAGQWREALDPAIARAIETAHGDVMRRHGYL